MSSTVARRSKAAAQALLASLIALAPLALPALAQQAGAPDSQPSAAEIQGMMAEYQEKQQRYARIHTQALSSSEELLERQDEISELVMETFFEMYPQAEAQIARLDEIQIEAMAAQQAQDMDRLGVLIGEAGNLQRELQMAQEQVLGREDVKGAIDAFEADLMALMLAIDPEAQTLRARLDEIVEVLNSVPPQGF